MPWSRAILLVGLMACAPDIPDAEWALEQYETVEADLDQLEVEILEAFAAFRPQSPETLKALIGNDEDRANQLVEAQNARADETSQAVQNQLQKLDSLLGHVFTFRFPNSDHANTRLGWGSLGEGGTPAIRNGSIDADSGLVTDDRRRIGWGFYAPAESENTRTESQPGLHVRLIHLQNGAQLEADLWFVGFDLPE